MLIRLAKIQVCFLTAISFCFAADIVLNANDADGYDNIWEARSSEGKPTWGIKGTGQSLQGTMWFNSFPGITGTYSIIFGIIAEDDGPPEYKIYAGGRLLKGGKYPCPDGNCGCSKGTEAATIDIGEHQINAGEKIEVWGKSVYPCGSHGAYTRWYELAFTLKSEIKDDTPPSAPGSARLLSKTNSSLSITWDAAADAESGIKQYRIFVDGSQLLAVNEMQATIGNLQKNTSYDIQISAVNGALKESAKSTAVSMTTDNKDLQVSAIFIRAVDGLLINGMAQSDASGALAGKPIYGTNGATAAPLPASSRAEYAIDFPQSGTWYIWGRFKFESGGKNSYWIKTIDDSLGQRFGNGEHALGAWHWEGYMDDGAVKMDIASKGTHVIEIQTREAANDNFLDALCLTQDASYVPADGDVVFSEMQIPKARVVSPNGGWAYAVDTPLEISWIADERFITDVDITLIHGDGITTEKLNTQSSISKSSAEWGAFVWTPTEDKLGEGYKIQVAKYEYTQSYETDISDNAFSIAHTAGQSTKHPLPQLSPAKPRISRTAGKIAISGLHPHMSSVQIISASGRTIESFSINNACSIILPARNLAAGLYMFIIETKGIRTRMHFMHAPDK